MRIAFVEQIGVDEPFKHVIARARQINCFVEANRLEQVQIFGCRNGCGRDRRLAATVHIANHLLVALHRQIAVLREAIELKGATEERLLRRPLNAMPHAIANGGRTAHRHVKGVQFRVFAHQKINTTLRGAAILF